MPLYDRILESVLNKINNGTLKEGDALPTEMELCAQFGVSRPTVRAALQKLQNEGYLTRVQGKGTFVARPKVVQESTRFIESYHQEMAQKGLTPRTVVLCCRVQPGSERVCEKLSLPAGEKVIKLSRLRFVSPSDEERPVVLTTVYVPYALMPELPDYDFEVFSLYEVLEKNNIIVKKVVRELEIKTLHGKTAAFLQAREHSAAHCISSVGFDKDGGAIEYSESFYPGDRNKFIITISR